MAALHLVTIWIVVLSTVVTPASALSAVGSGTAFLDPLVPCVLDPALPPALTAHADVQPLCAGFIDPTRPPYSASADGVTDATDALQRAINDAYTYRMVTWLPPGAHFKVSRGLTCVQDGRPPAMRAYGYQIVGASGGVRPIIQLEDHSDVVGGVLLYFQLVVNGTASPPSHYSAGLRGVDIDMGNNPTVSGVSMSAAQLSSIEDVRITGQSFLAGVVGLPGSGGFTANLHVIGGQIGVWQQQYRPNPSASGVVLTNQTCCVGCCLGTGALALPAAVLLQDSRGPLVLSGFAIQGNAGSLGYTAIRVVAAADVTADGPTSSTSGGADRSLALEDGTIDVQGPAGVAISDASSNDVSLSNVFVRAATAVECGNVTVLSAAGSWRRIVRWSYTASGSIFAVNGSGDIAVRGHELARPPLTLATAPVATPPNRAALLTMHSWDAATLPAWAPEPNAVIDIARDMGATPSWVNATDNDGPKIQAALAQAVVNGRPVFVPHGLFHVWDTIVIPANTSLIGAGRHVATISSVPARWPRDRIAPVVTVTGARATISDVVIQAELAVAAGIPPASCLLDVQADEVLVRDVRTFRLFNTTLPSSSGGTFANVAAVRFSKSAGGRFFGLSLDHEDFSERDGPPLSSSEVGTLITVNGTSNPIHLYQASVEHLADSQDQVVIYRAANVHLHAFKYESAPNTKYGKLTDPATGGLVGMHSCTNISIFGGSGNYGIMNASLSRDIVFAWGTTNLEITAVVRKPQEGEKAGTFWVRSTTAQGASVAISANKLGLLFFSGPDLPAPGLARL